jgi:hypothetical protein
MKIIPIILLAMLVLSSGCTQTGEVISGPAPGDQQASEPSFCRTAGFVIRNMYHEGKSIGIEITGIGTAELTLNAEVTYPDGDKEHHEGIGTIAPGEEDKPFAVHDVRRNVESVRIYSTECPGSQETVMRQDIVGLYAGDSEGVQDNEFNEDFCPECLFGIVTKIVDGDTLDMGDHRIRLSLVDAPEEDRPGYNESRDFTELTCPVGSYAYVDIDSKQMYDIYGRLNGVVYCNEKNLNELLLRYGHAGLMSYYCAISDFGQTDWAKEYGC